MNTISMVTKLVGSRIQESKSGYGTSIKYRQHEWKISLRRRENGKTKRMTVLFYNHETASEPTLEDVLGCLACDSNAYTCSRDFSDFCREFGYQIFGREDYLAAQKIYKACKRQHEKMVKFLGSDLNEVLTKEY